MDLDTLVNKFIDNQRKQTQQVVEENSVMYYANSKDYSDIQNYIIKNINPDFNLSDYRVEEYSIFDNLAIQSDETFIAPINNLVFRYQVGGYDFTFGYMVNVFDNHVKIINFIGEWKKDIDLDNINMPHVSDDELKIKVFDTDEDCKHIKVTEYKIDRYFDMEILKFRADVTVVFATDRGQSFAEKYTAILR